MHVSVTEAAVRDMLRDLLENGQAKEPAPVVVVEPPVQELPVDPNPEIGTEGVFEMPPIEDPDFEPGTQEELAKAAFAVGKSIPSQHITQFWKELDRLAARAETWQEDETMKMTESTLRRHIRKIIREAGEGGLDKDFYEDWKDVSDEFEFSDEEIADQREKLKGDGKLKKSWADINTGSPKRKKGKTTTAWDLAMQGKLDSSLGADYEGPSADQEQPLGSRHREATWEEIADMFGFRSPSGAKQFVDDPGRLGDRFRFLYQMYSKEPARFQQMMNDAVVAYADALLNSDAIDREDAEYIKNNPEHAQSLDSFRVFLKKYVMKLMRKDPAIQQHIKARKAKRDADRAARKRKKLGSMITPGA